MVLPWILSFAATMSAWQQYHLICFVLAYLKLVLGFVYWSHNHTSFIKKLHQYFPHFACFYEGAMLFIILSSSYLFRSYQKKTSLVFDSPLLKAFKFILYIISRLFQLLYQISAFLLNTQPICFMLLKAILLIFYLGYGDGMMSYEHIYLKFS